MRKKRIRQKTIRHHDIREQDAHKVSEGNPKNGGEKKLPPHFINTYLKSNQLHQL